MPRTIVDTNTTEETMPSASTLTKVFYAETLTGEKTQVAFVEEIPALEEAPDQITGKALDLDYEFTAPGIRKASTIELPVYYTHTQHKKLRDLQDKNLYWFFQNPASTAPADSDPLVRYFQGIMKLTTDKVSAGEFIKDKMTIYKNTAVEESEGFPKAV